MSNIETPMRTEVAEKSPRSESDTAWKLLLDVYFPQLLSFFYPKLYGKIDWSRGYHALDKELEKITQKASVGKRYVDKLIQVYSREGQQTIVLCHLEIQSKPQAHFSRRLFEYYCRLYLHYQEPIITLVILTDNSPKWRPQAYQFDLWGHPIIHFYFYVSKLLDYRGKEALLAEDTNPFAWVILVQLAAIETSQDPKQRLQKKFTLTRYLYKRNFNRETIIELYSFIDWILRLPKTLETHYDAQIRQLEEETDMNYITRIEQQGIQQGIQQGMQEGVQQGMHQGECTLFLRLLRHKFKQIPQDYVIKINEADSACLLRWGELLLGAKTLEEVFVEI
jgi:predicted transposase YdaD